MIGLEDHSTTIYHGAFHQGLIFQPTTRQCLWEANLHPTKYLIGKGIGVGGTLCDTQAGSRDIRCRESFWDMFHDTTCRGTVSGSTSSSLTISSSLTHVAPGFEFCWKEAMHCITYFQPKGC
ncbi:hypothetical protein VNO77_38823 [Canavalia gladiata]|uniref:Uncharacterized protein n=1 Tax=Canavalia gladiata TaxID=3824 RepID=A0AAN9KB42_CANGL